MAQHNAGPGSPKNHIASDCTPLAPVQVETVEKVSPYGQVKKNRTNADVIGQGNPNSQRERPKIERKFAEQKRYHGLAQARYWGLRRVTIQVLMTCLVVNCKRMARLVEANCGPPQEALCPG